MDNTHTAPIATHTHPAPFRVALTLDEGYAFSVNPLMGDAAPFVIDEPPPLSTGRGPNPVRVLASALGSCLGASLLFCLRKARVEVRGLTIQCAGTMGRNERGRLHVASIVADLQPVVAAADVDKVARCASVFEDYCIVSQSIRNCVDVAVTVTAVSA